ncbi:THUMP-like domain-containing protein, partial [Flavobacterium covae]|uniref:THUMP-like domain-containing protein n=1 Tax=Flavobacterium covae TaxID=2906076 RepID=UPI00349681EB
KVLKIALKIKRGTQSKKHTLGFKGLHGIFSTFFSIPAQNRKKHLEGKKANITTRNFPETVETIRKKWKIKEGGNLYAFFTTD